MGVFDEEEYLSSKPGLRKHLQFVEPGGGGGAGGGGATAARSETVHGEGAESERVRENQMHAMDLARWQIEDMITEMAAQTV